MKEHCCCFLSLDEGVLALGPVLLATHLALLTVNIVHGHVIFTLDNEPNAHLVLVVSVAIHLVAIFINALFVLGLWLEQNVLILPWLLLQFLIALALAILALYYLYQYASFSCVDADEMGDCPGFVWQACFLVLCLVILVYHVYVVCVLLQQQRHRARLKAKIEQVQQFQPKTEHHVDVTPIQLLSKPTDLNVGESGLS